LLWLAVLSTFREDWSAVAMVSNGSIKWFDFSKGYGFIKVPDGGLDVFVHANELRKSGIVKISDGDKVKFEMNTGPKGAFASNISLAPKEGGTI
jgi:CspA family cold shock protein